MVCKRNIRVAKQQRGAHLSWFVPNFVRHMKSHYKAPVEAQSTMKQGKIQFPVVPKSVQEHKNDEVVIEFIDE